VGVASRPIGGVSFGFTERRVGEAHAVLCLLR
jgi:hypothetical protein